MIEPTPLSAMPCFDDELIDELLDLDESRMFETKRVAGSKLTRALESIVALANTDGGMVVFGFEDKEKAAGRDRVFGVQENSTAVDELRRLVSQRITPTLASLQFAEIGCTLRDGTIGSVMIVSVDKSPSVHSIVANGTWVRLDRGNRELVAEEITRLALDRGTLTAESRPAQVAFDLLDTDYWRMYSTKRRLTRSLPEALRHLGLAVKSEADGTVHPNVAAVLLFAEQPGGLLATKWGVRVFHYKGGRVEHSATPNLLKPPRSFTGPLVTQVYQAVEYVLSELATGVQLGPLGFEVIQQYPVRVIREAITNAVIHRDYSIASDVHVRLFADRIEVESPGTLPGKVTAPNISVIGSVSRNPLIVSHLREFPDPPNLDAGEGVRMMFSTMSAAGLYPPLYLTRASTGRDSVTVLLLNEARPTVWDQVCRWLDEYGTVGNAEVRQIMSTDNTLAASKVLRSWVDRGLLVVANPDGAKRNRRYRRPEAAAVRPLLSRRAGK